MESIVRYLQDMGFYMVLILPVILVVRIIQIKRNNQKANLIREAGIVLFFMYIAGLLSQTILPAVSTNDGNVEFVNGDHKAINLEPFRVLIETYNAIRYLNLWQPFLINFLGNIVMFLPLGFFLPLLWKKFNHAWKVVGTGLLLSLAIEILQLPQMRSSDVDDLWLNTLGTALGYLLFRNLPKKIRIWFKTRNSG